MKTVLITGGYGLVGTSLVYYLLKKNFKIVIIDHQRKKRKKAFKSSKNLKVFNGNFVNKKTLDKLFKKFKFDGVFHLGAKTQVLDALKNPFKTYETNVIGTLNLIEKIKENKTKIPFIYSSSDFIYGSSKEKDLKKKKNFFLESDKFEPGLPYETSKLSSDLICQSYSKTFSLKIGIVRSANIYGPHDNNPNRIVPETIISVLKNKKLLIRSSGKLKRDYLFVEDACLAYFLIFQKLSNKKLKKNLLIYNLSSNYNSTTIQIVRLIYKLFKKKPNYLIKDISKQESQSKRLSFDKIRKEVKWLPKTGIEEGLKKTINWYIKNFR